MAAIDPFTPEGAKQIAAIAGQQPAPISAGVLNTPKLANLPQPVETPLPIAPALPSIADILGQTNGDTALSKQFTDTTIDTANTSAELAGEGGFRSTQEQTYDLAGKKATANDLTNRFNGLKAQADQIPLQIQQDFAGRGATAGGVAPIQTGELRNNAIQQIGISAMLNAANGNLSTAQDQVDYAVKAKFDPLKAQLVAQQAQLAAITPLLEREDKKRATAQAALLDERSRLLAKAETEQKNINSVMLTAAQYNADAKTLTAIQNASSYAEAISAAGQYIQDPKAKYELESARLDNILKRAQITKTQTETAQIGQPTAAELKEQKAAEESAKATVPVLNDKITLIKGLMTSPGLAGSVGANPLARSAPDFNFFTGVRQDFISGVQQLVSKDTLDTLLALKAQGGTLGALSEGEGRMLASAATKIGTWTIKDKDGNVTGYNASEADFKRELRNILDITERAYQKTGGTLITPDEKAALSEFYSGGAASTSATVGTFNPASYY